MDSTIVVNLIVFSTVANILLGNKKSDGKKEKFHIQGHMTRAMTRAGGIKQQTTNKIFLVQ